MTDIEKLKWFFNKYIIQEQSRLFFIVFLIIIASISGSLSPYLYGKMVDRIVAGDIDALIKLIIIYFVITQANNLLSLIENHFGQVTQFKISKKIQNQLFETIVHLRMDSSLKYETGELVSRLNGDSDVIVSFILNFITSIFQLIINLGISLYFVLTISVSLSLVSLFYIPGVFLLILYIRKHYKMLFEKQKKVNDQYYSFQHQAFSNLQGIKCYGLENHMVIKYSAFVEKQKELLLTSIKLGNINQLIGSLLKNISALVIIFMSAILIKNNVLTIGLMVSFNTYINQLFSSITQLFGMNISIQNVIVSIDRILELKNETEEVPRSHTLSDKIYTISFDKVKFYYPNSDKKVLNEFDYHISKSGLYGIVGENGCGKSTIAKLLVNFYDTSSGRIIVNGHNIKTLPVNYLRSIITYVSQDEFFFNDSIINNLTMTNEKIEYSEIINFCKHTGVHDFVDKLENKYETRIGEGGVRLSGGQKQKMSITRALLRKSPVYVFDEITANLDGASEREIMSVVKEASKTSVIIIISHNPSTIEKCEQISVLDMGDVIATGSHEELLSHNELYFKLFDKEKMAI